MSPLAISAVIFVCVYGGAMAGMSLRSRLPEPHRSAETRDVVKLGMGLVATMSALLLGLLISSAKSSYDTQKTELTQVTARLVFLDHVLAHYGPETKEIRGLVRNASFHLVSQLWPNTPPVPAVGDPGVIFDQIQALSPKDEAHRLLQAQALTLAIELGQTRGLMIEQRGSSVSTALLGRRGVLARDHLRELRPVRAGQRHGPGGAAGLRALRVVRDLPDPRNGPPLRGTPPDPQRPDARDLLPPRPVGPRAGPRLQ